MSIVNPVVLEGEFVHLEPLRLQHLDALCEVGLDHDLWSLNAHPVSTREEMEAYILAALDGQEHGLVLPFVTIERERGRVVGSTRFGNIDLENRRVEVGWTWIAKPWQRTTINTEAKLLMLHHAFEVWNCNRVELKTDALNERSCAAILRIGAKEEGTLRNHMVTASGRLRDTVYFSILRAEWPDVERRLRDRIDRIDSLNAG